ncbi:MAG TPA: insulinase family protein [Geothrix sp.]|nr:insulinase family protein [Geothrix sp.]
MRTLLLALLAVLGLRAESRPQRFVLPNGLTVVLLEAHEHPLVRARMHLSLGPADRPPGCPDLPERFLRLLDRADRGDRKIWECDRDLEGQGIQLVPTATPEGLDWRLLARSRDQDRSLGLLGDLLLRPILDPDAWKNPCGISWDEVQAFSRKVLRPDRAILVLQGDLGLEQAKQLALLSLGTWTASPATPTPPPPPAITPEVQALRALLAIPGEAPRRYQQEDLDRARRAWVGQQNVLSLDPEAQMAQALGQAQGRAPRGDRMNALTLEDLNR